jgi:TRAP-type C4-dicarboxylate transport system permease small subunit
VTLLYPRILQSLAACAAVLLGAAAAAITFDVVARNLAVGSLPWILEVSEYVLPLATFLVAPWLLYRNEHVRLDILLGGRPCCGARRT